MTGGDGRLASQLKPLLDCVALSRKELDVLDEAQLESAIAKHKPHAIIHLAAITNPKTADQDRLGSYRVNVLGTRNVARAAAKHRIKVIYLSSDYVFTGDIGGYRETDAPSPPNWYGFTKYAGELEVEASGARHCIIRTSFRPMKWEFPTAFSDVFTSADYVDVIAQEIALCLEKGVDGIIHLGTPTKTFYELARRRTPDVRAEVCPDPAFPRKRDLDISQWLRIKEGNP